MNINNGQENLSTEQPSPGEEARLPRANGNQERAGGDRPPPRERAQTSDAAPLLETAPDKLDFTFPKAHKLRKPAEFQRVYKAGKKFDGRLLTAFVLINQNQCHRLGITASRKGVGNAVQRNRAKRLLREAFRLSKIELNVLRLRYDIVLNARRSLLKVKAADAIADFRRVLTLIVKHENLTANEASANANQTNANLKAE